MVYYDTPALRQVTVLNAQESDLTEPLVEEVRQMWRDWELGNDYFYLTWHEEYQEDYPLVTQYLKDHNITGDILIHWWW